MRECYVRKRKKGRLFLGIFTFVHVYISLIRKKNRLQLGCEEVKTASFLPLVPAYCARILQDLVNLEAWSFPNVARDLMMEQSACDKKVFHNKNINPSAATCTKVSTENRLCAGHGRMYVDFTLTIECIYTLFAIEG